MERSFMALCVLDHHPFAIARFSTNQKACRQRANFKFQKEMTNEGAETNSLSCVWCIGQWQNVWVDTRD